MRRILFATVVLTLSAFGVAQADQPMFASRDGAAIGGYDTVAYFMSGEPVRGHRDIAVQWKGAVWLFSSQRNRETFESNPRAFAPQYGGYCAYAVSRGGTSQTDPRAWRIVDGKLYLIHNNAVLRLWLDDLAGNIGLSDANWPAVLRD